MTDQLHTIAAPDAEVNLNGLRIVLLALLPKDGTPRSVAELAANTGATPSEVIDALLDDYMSGALEFDVRADTYRIATPEARTTGGTT